MNGQRACPACSAHSVANQKQSKVHGTLSYSKAVHGLPLSPPRVKQYWSLLLRAGLHASRPQSCLNYHETPPGRTSLQSKDPLNTFMVVQGEAMTQKHFGPVNRQLQIFKLAGDDLEDDFGGFHQHQSTNPDFGRMREPQTA